MPTAAALSFEEFCRAEQAWNALVAASSRPQPFLSHRWLRLWWRHFGAGQEFNALVVRDGDRLLAGIPIALRKVRVAGATLTVGEIVGTGPVPTRGMGLADQADLVVRVDSPASGRLLAAELMSMLDRVDVFDIKGFDRSSPTADLLRTAAARSGSVRVLNRSVSPFLRLPPSWDGYLESRSRNFRKHLVKYERMLAQAGKLVIQRMDKNEDPEAWMRELLQVNAASWTAARGTDLLRPPQIRGFMRELVSEFVPRGWIDLWLLRLGGQPIACELCFDFAGRVCSYHSSFRKEYAKLSPGTVLTAAVIRSACERGRSEYDLLRGAEAYKSRWSETVRSELQLLAPADRWRARLLGCPYLYLKGRLKSWPWVDRLDYRISGLIYRLRYRR